MWYGLERIIVEGMRTDSLYIGNTGIRVSQALSFAIVFVCGILLVINLVRFTKNPKPIDGVDFYGPMTEKEWAAHERKLARRKKAKDWRSAKKAIIKEKLHIGKVSYYVSDTRR
ncbi:MAG: prolipoprotein diacylglyceryl transferase [Clostridia bacterium]|nr:prolipoprotein diacylglyceryl transferase [Clostridia bacterium]